MNIIGPETQMEYLDAPSCPSINPKISPHKSKNIEIKTPSILVAYADYLKEQQAKSMKNDPVFSQNQISSSDTIWVFTEGPCTQTSNTSTIDFPKNSITTPCHPVLPLSATLTSAPHQQQYSLPQTHPSPPPAATTHASFLHTLDLSALRSHKQ